MIEIDWGNIGPHLHEAVHSTAEETQNALKDAEAGALCRARGCEQTGARANQRRGTTGAPECPAGEVGLRFPGLRTASLETAIVERYRQQESPVDEALVERYLARVSMHLRGGHHTGALGDASWGEDGQGPEPGDLRPDRGVALVAHRGRARQVFPDRIWLTLAWGGEVQNGSV